VYINGVPLPRKGRPQQRMQVMGSSLAPHCKPQIDSAASVAATSGPVAREAAARMRQQQAGSAVASTLGHSSSDATTRFPATLQGTRGRCMRYVSVLLQMRLCCAGCIIQRLCTDPTLLCCCCRPVPGAPREGLERQWSTKGRRQVSGKSNLDNHVLQLISWTDSSDSVASSRAAPHAPVSLLTRSCRRVSLQRNVSTITLG
jgi:hypothetical protein